MTTTIALTLLILLAALLVFVQTRPDEFHISRSIAIQAPPETIFPLINHLPSNAKWGPWEEEDPNMKRTLSGPESGVGAVYAWDGNNRVGKGQIEIVKSVPFSRVEMLMTAEKPFEAQNQVILTLDKQGGETIVTWEMAGRNNFITKAVGLVMSCDAMVGQMFEKGLAKMKRVAEESVTGQ